MRAGLGALSVVLWTSMATGAIGQTDPPLLVPSKPRVRAGEATVEARWPLPSADADNVPSALAVCGADVLILRKARIDRLRGSDHGWASPAVVDEALRGIAGDGTKLVGVTRDGEVRALSPEPDAETPRAFSTLPAETHVLDLAYTSATIFAQVHVPTPTAGRRRLAVFAQNRAASDAPWQRIETGTPVRLHDSRTTVDPICARGQGFVACRSDSLLAFDATGTPTEAMLLPAGVVLVTVDGDDAWGIVSKTKKPPWAFELVRLRAAWHPCAVLSIEVVEKGKRGSSGWTEGRVLRWVLEGKPLDSERAVRRQLLRIAQRTPQPIVVIAPGRDAIYGDVALPVDAVRDAGLEGVFL